MFKRVIIAESLQTVEINRNVYVLVGSLLLGQMMT